MVGSARRIRVALLFGGRSTEHSISCVSAAGVLRALDRDRYDVVPVGITAAGAWLLQPEDGGSLAPTAGRLPEVTPDAGMPVSLSSEALAGVDVVFPMLHGPYGEDGTIQGMLEMAGLPYVGSGVFASAAAMDKQHMKTLLAAAGLTVGPYAVLKAGQDLVTAERDRLGLPLFVKPARGGSSIGISRVDAWADLDTAVKTARAADPKVIVEAGVVGREVECAVLGGLGGEPPQPSLPAEVIVSSASGFYDFEAKYASDSTRFDVPASLPAVVTRQVQEVAVTAFDALDCAGLARVDVFVTPAGDVVVNEVNTMPGFTPNSMFPRMWEATGVSYSELVDRLIGLAVERGAGLR